MWAQRCEVAAHPLHRASCLWLCKSLVGLPGQEEVAVEKWEETCSLGCLWPLKLLAHVGLKQEDWSPTWRGRCWASVPWEEISLQ